MSAIDLIVQDFSKLHLLVYGCNCFLHGLELGSGNLYQCWAGQILIRSIGTKKSVGDIFLVLPVLLSTRCRIHGASVFGAGVVFITWFVHIFLRHVLESALDH